MLSKKDEAIAENILKPKTVETFHKHIYIRKSDDAIVADSLEEFMTKITDPCHIWRGFIDKFGYGLFQVYATKGRNAVLAHRFAYALHHGIDALPDGAEGGKRYVLNHLCHNTACVNPLHLESITNKLNLSPEKRKPKDV
jgi:hypothetical protein